MDVVVDQWREEVIALKQVLINLCKKSDIADDPANEMNTFVNSMKQDELLAYHTSRRNVVLVTDQVINWNLKEVTIDGVAQWYLSDIHLGTSSLWQSAVRRVFARHRTPEMVSLDHFFLKDFGDIINELL